MTQTIQGALTRSVPQPQRQGLGTAQELWLRSLGPTPSSFQSQV